MRVTNEWTASTRAKPNVDIADVNGVGAREAAIDNVWVEVMLGDSMQGQLLTRRAVEATFRFVFRFLSLEAWLLLCLRVRKAREQSQVRAAASWEIDNFHAPLPYTAITGSRCFQRLYGMGYCSDALVCVLHLF
jgi:hypothetical protein